ncbi:flavin reductase family protein [Zavarzinia sp. CC-PAN008]|uniref:flavin reductase family protein n=1 Tax=Zavarzinia sp. CC-PAN008 TaxID=3243332 RepID=UPI003F74A7E1
MSAIETERFDSRRFRDVLSRFCSGVVIITGLDEGKAVGFAAQSFTSVSLDPPLVAFCPANTSSTWPRIRKAGKFCINILREDQEPVSRNFAQTGVDKFATVPWRTEATGSPVLTDSLAWIDCVLDAEHVAGDHTIVIGRVLDLADHGDHPPLLYYRSRYGRFHAEG